jgi:hypothetical protein
MMRYLIIFLNIIICIACKKEKATDVDSNVIGEWVLYGDFIKQSDKHFKNSRGYNYGSGTWPMTGDQARKWFIKDTILQFGHAPKEWAKFHIDSFPKIATVIDTVG